MAERIVKVPTASISKEISDFTIGLAKLAVHNRVEDALLSGTGTLVSVGAVHGLLTAAHVLAALPSHGPVGVILFKEDRQIQKQVIEMAHATPITICGEQFDHNGPDLGFLRLPPANVGWLKAMCSFYNLRKHRDEALKNVAPVPNYIEALIGMIEELTKEIPVEKPLKRAKAFTAIFCNGEAQNAREANGFDLVDVAVTAYPDFPLPDSFEGMSGGALWRMYFTETDDTVAVVSKRLVGVPFYESNDAAGKTIITCHAMSGIYTALFDRIVAKWPEESNDVSP